MQNLFGSRKGYADEDGWTPLHKACTAKDTAKESYDIVNMLLNAAADINKSNKYGDTPLCWAAWNHSKSVALLLLNKGAEVNKANKLAPHVCKYSKRCVFIYMINRYIH